MTDATDKEFQQWLSLMDDGLEALFARLPEEAAAKLDYSIESLDVLEAWLLERYPTCELAFQDSEAMVFEEAGRYIGESFRKIVGGRWSIERRPKFVFKDTPVIVDFTVPGSQICPESWAAASIDQRTGTCISSGFRNMLMDQAALERRASRTRESAEQAFQSWLSAMDDVIEAFFQQLPNEVSAKLDYSMESLDVLEAWMLERYPAGDAADEITRLMKWTSTLDPATVPPLLDAVSRYVGETFCKTVGGRWWHDVDLQEFGIYGELPLIVEFSPEPAPMCPLTTATDAIKDREGSTISRFFRSVRDEIPILRAHLQNQ